jgi:hypothetical protein
VEHPLDALRHLLMSLGNCHFATDKNTFLGREAVQWTADRKIQKIAEGDFRLIIGVFTRRAGTARLP